MKIIPEIRFLIDWTEDGTFIDETKYVQSASIPMFRISFLSDLQPKSAATSGTLSLTNLTGRYSLNQSIPNKDTELEPHLKNFGIAGKPIAITMSDDSDPATLPFTSIFYGRITMPTTSDGDVSFKLQDRLSFYLQHKIDTDLYKSVSFDDLVDLYDDTGSLFKIVGGFPFTFEYAWADNKSIIDEVIVLTKSALGYVVADNSPIISIYSWDNMIVDPLDEITIDVRRHAEGSIETTSLDNVFNKLSVEYRSFNIAPSGTILDSKDMHKILPGDVNAKVEFALPSPVLNEEAATVTYNIVKADPNDDVVVTWEMFAKKIVFDMTNNSNNIAFLANVNVEAYTVKQAEGESKETFETDDYSLMYEFLRTADNSIYIQDRWHARWLALSLVKRMNRYSMFGTDVVKVTNAIPNEKYAFGRPVNLIDKFGESKLYYIIEASAKFDSLTGLWFDLTFISHAYLYGEDDHSGNPPYCDEYYVIGVHELDNQRVCAI